jgi:hypothetical protein
VGQARLPARKIREVLRLKAEGFSERQKAPAIGSARSTAQDCARGEGDRLPIAAIEAEGRLGHADGCRRLFQSHSYNTARRRDPREQCSVECASPADCPTSVVVENNAHQRGDRRASH